MKCKKHLTDLSSAVGVCSTCLRERLLAVIAAQTRLDSERAAAEDHRRKHDQPSLPPLVFPRSVSPYVSRRKSDHRRFYSTPQVDLTAADFDAAVYSKKKHRFSIFSSLFGSRSEKFNLDSRVHHHRDSCDEPSSSTPSWLSSIFTVGRKNQQSPARTSHVEYVPQFGPRDRKPRIDRGMSPAIETNSRDECNRSPPLSSPEVSPRWKRKPRKVRTGPKNNISGMAFCLSPLVRASPNRQWNQKSGLPPDEGRPPTKPHLAAAAGFCANRSKKIADFGRVNYNR